MCIHSTHSTFYIFFLLFWAVVVVTCLSRYLCVCVWMCFELHLYTYSVCTTTASPRLSLLFAQHITMTMVVLWFFFIFILSVCLSGCIYVWMCVCLGWLVENIWMRMEVFCQSVVVLTQKYYIWMIIRGKGFFFLKIFILIFFPRYKKFSLVIFPF